MGNLSKVLVLFITCALCWCFSINIAHAEEVELTPSDTFNYSVHVQNNAGLDKTITTDTYAYPDSSYYWIGGNFLKLSRVQYKYGSYDASVDSPGFNPYENGYYLDFYNYYPKNTTNTPVVVPDFYVTITGGELELDTNGLLAGYYRYESEIYIGCAFAGVGSYNYQNMAPNYTYSSTPIPLPSGGTFTYMGSEAITTSSSSVDLFTTALLHFHFEETLYLPGDDEPVVWDLSPGFQYAVGILDYPGLSITKNHSLIVFGNNRFDSALYSNVEPPVTPTPSPTPYPGQDTQESINAGVQQIVQDLSVYATPVPTPGEITLDPTAFDYLEDLTLPDVSEGSRDISNMWLIFTPAVGYLTLLATSIFVVSIFIYIIRGGWL